MNWGGRRLKKRVSSRTMKDCRAEGGRGGGGRGGGEDGEERSPKSGEGYLEGAFRERGLRPGVSSLRRRGIFDQRLLVGLVARGEDVLNERKKDTVGPLSVLLEVILDVSVLLARVVAVRRHPVKDCTRLGLAQTGLEHGRSP